MAGRAVHLVLQQVLMAGETVEGVLPVVRSVFAELGVDARQPAVRVRCVTAVCVYLVRFRPDGWSLTGVEHRLGAGIADLVWSSPDGDVLVDEVKLGVVGPDSRHTRDQARRLAEGGLAEFGSAFLGVRVVPLRAPGRTWFVGPDGKLTTTPVSLVVR